MKTKLLMLGALALFVGCGEPTTSDANTDNTVGMATLRSVDLLNENGVVLSTSQYTETSPGESAKFERSFENAPPLISHSTEGLVPITADNNQCAICHDKSIAEGTGATPIPASHYVRLRTLKRTGDAVSSERFNCTQCHVPQSDAKIVVGNSFRPSFSKESLRSSSNLLDVLNEGVK